MNHKYSNEQELSKGILEAFMGHRKIETYTSELNSICVCPVNFEALKSELLKEEVYVHTEDGGDKERMVFSKHNVRGFAVYRSASDFIA